MTETFVAHDFNILMIRNYELWGKKIVRSNLDGSNLDE